MTRPKARRKAATRAEHQVAADLGGRRTFLSGAGDEKADVVVPRQFAVVDGILQETSRFSFRVEVKTTAATGYSLHALDWLKVVHAADKAGQAPVFVMKTDLKRIPVAFAAIRNSFFRELDGQDGQLEEKFADRKSVRVDRNTLQWYGTRVAHRRVHFRVRADPRPVSRGDIVIMYYDDFLRLVLKAEES